MSFSIFDPEPDPDAGQVSLMGVDTVAPKPSAVAVANRLKLVGTEFADRPVKDRESRLSEIITEATAQMTAQDRGQFLDELKNHFPAWGAVDVTVNKKGELLDPLPDDPMTMTENLISAFRSAPEETRRQMMRALASAGMAPAASGMPEASIRLLRQQMEIPEQNKIEPARVIDLLIGLARPFSAVEEQVRVNLAMGARERAAAPMRPLRELFVQFLSYADNDSVRPRLRQEIEARVFETTKKIGLFPFVQRAFIRDLVRKFSPNSIIGVVDAGGWLRGRAAMCWERYVELCGGPDDQAMQHVLETMHRDAENGVNPPPSAPSPPRPGI